MAVEVPAIVRNFFILGKINVIAHQSSNNRSQSYPTKADSAAPFNSPIEHIVIMSPLSLNNSPHPATPPFQASSAAVHSHSTAITTFLLKLCS
jgi:hypothetical protein